MGVLVLAVTLCNVQFLFFCLKSEFDLFPAVGKIIMPPSESLIFDIFQFIPLSGIFFAALNCGFTYSSKVDAV